MVSCLIFKSLSHFEFIFVHGGVTVCSNFIDFTCCCPAFPTPLAEETVFFSIVYSCFLCLRLIDRRHVGLFLGSLFCFIDWGF